MFRGGNDGGYDCMTSQLSIYSIIMENFKPLVKCVNAQKAVMHVDLPSNILFWKVGGQI